MSPRSQSNEQQRRADSKQKIPDRWTPLSSQKVHNKTNIDQILKDQYDQTEQMNTMHGRQKKLVLQKQAKMEEEYCQLK